MENRSLALRLVAEAVHLDSNGFSHAAFEKYVQSLQALAIYLNEMFNSLVQSPSAPSLPVLKSDRSVTLRKSRENLNLFKLPAIEKLQNENTTLFKQYQWRIERAKDNYARTNLKLELERRIAENDVIAKKKFDIAVKQLQKERASVAEQEMKKFFGNQQLLSESEREKRDLFVSVIEYTKTETWPCTWKLNYWEISDVDAVKKIFETTMRCSDHPLSQWITMVKTNIKRDVDASLRHYSLFEKLLPSVDLNGEGNLLHVEDYPDELVFCKDSEKTGIAKHNLVTLQKALVSISSEIMYTISCVADIFYLAYKSLLPLDSEEICLSFVEQFILKSVWSNLIVLYRIENIIAEYKIAEAMRMFQNSVPSEFGITTQSNTVLGISEQCISILKSLPETESLVEKLKILVQVSQIICGSPSHGRTNQKTRIGADEFMPILSFILVKSKLPRMSSECYAIEQLFDVKFMFGEEGYALSSFLTAFKYIEMKKLIDGGNKKDDG
ncbi:VPS9 domain-containing protein 1 isoform X2 [Parasteatoda tepidariorum]|uniref:VPS9 domain-containing protein 1 isoform X2 n=1 Tax=Parasteatoda tepidariorum TaxID=114398 RepID=UPI0039BD603E